MVNRTASSDRGASGRMLDVGQITSSVILTPVLGFLDGPQGEGPR